MPNIKINDIQMTYEIHGQGEPLVLIQGFTCNRLFWKDYLPLLSQHFQVLVFDNRGSGQTDAPAGPYNMKMLAKDTVELMHALKWESAYMIGHSMGGAIVQQICLDFPKAIKKGMVCASFNKVPPKSLLQIATRAKLAQSGLSRELLLTNSLPWLYSNDFLSNEENVKMAVGRALLDPYPQSITGFLAQADALRQYDNTHLLHQIQTPLLIVHGEEDIYTPIEGAEILASEIPNAELYIFERQGHVFTAEKMSEVVELIMQYFLR